MLKKLLPVLYLSLIPFTGALAQHLENGQPDQEKIEKYKPRFGRKQPIIAVLAMNEGTELTDFVIPFGVLSKSGIAKVISVSTSPGMVTIEPFKFKLQSNIANFDKEYPQGADYIIIPAIHGGDDTELVKWIAAQGAKGSTVVSICLGAMVVAKTGMMDHRRATSYFGNESQRMEQFPYIKWQKNVRYVADGSIISSAGISASIPISIALVEAISGHSKAVSLAKDLGISDWSAIHNSDAFQEKDREAPRNYMKSNPKEIVGIPIKKGDDEIALALIAETYRFSGMAIPYAISKTNKPVELANGLIVIPGKINNGFNPVQRMTSALPTKKTVAVLDSSLNEIEKTYGRTAAYDAARRMEYPGFENYKVLPGLDNIRANSVNFKKGKKINVAFLVYDQVEALDLNGPVDIFAKANKMDSVYNLYTVSPTNEAVYSEGNIMKITATYTISNAPQADILVIPGADPEIITDLSKRPEIIKWIKNQNNSTDVTMSICTGALLLSTAGILEGKSATTHSIALNTLQSNPKINVLKNKRYVHDGKIITTAGITSGLDGTLHLIDMINGKKIADTISEILIYNRNGDMSFTNKLLN
ncbi:DJ-1/PfpI family protein [Pedobacter antarcticus]|uniref:DJ-1/PfpI family protein n=1 Tax=Pedobacter antarcticus TaxID=34086 RepID=UPI00292DEDAB|nr:DJ-1/PfpI family protein [Pedobacter antarcticus]